MRERRKQARIGGYIEEHKKGCVLALAALGMIFSFSVGAYAAIATTFHFLGTKDDSIRIAQVLSALGIEIKGQKAQIAQLVQEKAEAEAAKAKAESDLQVANETIENVQAQNSEASAAVSGANANVNKVAQYAKDLESANTKLKDYANAVAAEAGLSDSSIDVDNTNDALSQVDSELQAAISKANDSNGSKEKAQQAVDEANKAK
ncbi:hypothetical protein FQS90_13880 [Enterococcus casseliflavus]|uniref:hypothetical protein n=1 Tax=unclassified Enterococcus TaxID=2608891 RepID=UPI000B3ECFFE|nr:hypothetical protein [Enterococcus sp. 8E11_MSG4843]MBO1097604.1 hypothetical protein [Enterococcus casseliflavus]MBO1143420.1 hypothetical protein [Enterococcus casseliflavus]MBV6372952.1 hypothetical protein [Enterococcus casseliflavus]OUZ33917.1 hypothetical protein A5885_001632 [Enterococcus sp. 8E11_MSG4843]